MPRQPFQAKAKTRDCASARIDNMSYLPVSESVIFPQPPLYFFAVTKIVQIERIKKQLVDFFCSEMQPILSDSANPELDSEPGHRFCQ